LEKLRIEPGFTGTFGEQAEAFVRLHRCAGQPFIFNRYALIAFNRFIRKQGSDDVKSVTPDIVKQWVGTLTCSAGMRRQRLRILQQFFEHLCNLRVIKTSPVPWSLIDSFGRVDRTFRPYIFTEAQIQALLAATQRLPRIRPFPLCPEVMHAAIATLYTLGLRINEALCLRLADIDEKQQMLFIRQAKFHKERHVPYGPRFAACLGSYLEARRADGVSTAGESPLFVRWSDQPLTAGTFRRHYLEAMKDAGIVHGEGPKPRIHDLRHAFAVHRLLRWYREGVDVQKRLVLLSTFMGHVSIYSTQVYLTITGTLLGEANKRFLNAFGSVAEGGKPSKP
jgi:site-specific recombinase XerD